MGRAGSPPTLVIKGERQTWYRPSTLPHLLALKTAFPTVRVWPRFAYSLTGAALVLCHRVHGVLIVLSKVVVVAEVVGAG